MPVTIQSIFPLSSASGVSPYSHIQVILSSGIDETTVGPGSFFVEGPARDVVSGPYMAMNYAGSSVRDVFTDPSFYGIVNASIDFDGVGTDCTTPLGTTDLAATATYYSRATLYPDKPFTPLTQYTVYLVGTDTSTAFRHGISRRTVFGAVADGANVGDGQLCPHGGYTATGTWTYEVEIASGGYVGAGVYKWRRGTAGAFSKGIRTHSYRKSIEHGLQLAFDASGSFAAGDSYSILAREPECMTGIYTFSFVTGPLGTAIIPGTASSLVSTAAPPVVSSPFPGLALGYTYPVSPCCNLATDRTSFTFYFNRPLSTTVQAAGIEIWVGAPDGDSRVRAATTYTATSYSISGSTLTVNL